MNEILISYLPQLHSKKLNSSDRRRPFLILVLLPLIPPLLRMGNPFVVSGEMSVCQ